MLSFFKAGVNDIRKYTKEWLEELCSDSFSLAEVLRKAERKQSGGNQEILKNKIKEFDIDISHFVGQRWYDSPRFQKHFLEKPQFTKEEIFVKESSVTQKTLRKYVEKYKIIEYKCFFVE